MFRPSNFAVFSLLSVAALAGFACKSESASTEQSAPIRIDAQRFRADLFDDDHAIGGAAPLVTIVVFSDYACPPCGRTWQVMKNLVEDYGEDLRVVYRAYTVAGFPRGEEAAEAALAAGRQDKFWEMHWRLVEKGGDLTRPVLRAHAEALGLDVPRFLDDLDTGAGAGVRIRHKREAVRLGVQGLPVVFFNGLVVVGAQPEAAWHALIDEEIARVKPLLGEGVARAKLYGELMKGSLAQRSGVDAATEALRKQAKDQQGAAATVASTKQPSPDKRYAVVPDGDTPVRGPADAPVVIVEFTDFQCPFCKRMWDESLSKVLAEHKTEVRHAVRHLPLEIHESAKGAAAASIAAHRQGKFWEFHDALFAHDGSMGRLAFVDIAKRIGLDVDRFLADLDAPETMRGVERDLELARRLGANGTPTLFVNGRYFHGYQDAATLGAIVREELEHAKHKQKQGIARARVFESLMAEAVQESDFPNH